MKKTKTTKLLTLLLASVMTISALSGCSNNAKESTADSKVPEASTQSTQEQSAEEVPELEPVTLKWYYDGAEKEGTQDVIEAFNAKLAEVLPNTTVEFTFVSDYRTNWPLLLSGEEKMDIAWAGWKTNFLQDVNDGNLLPLTDLVEEYAPILKEEMETFAVPYNSAMYEGELWGIPGVQPVVAEAQNLTVGETFYEYIDMDAFIQEVRNNRKLTSKLLDIIEEGVQAAIDAGVFEVGKNTWYAPVYWQCGLMGYMMVGAQGNNFWFDPEAENPEAMYWLEVPEVKMYLERIAKWYDMGWLTDAQMLDQMTATAYTTVNVQPYYNQKWANADENGVEFATEKDREGHYKVYWNTPEEGYVGMNNFGSENTYLVIPYTAENPERAIMLLDILRGEEGTVGYELMNMLCYGFEKDSEEAKKYGWFNYAEVEKDGQMVADTSARGDASDKHSMYNWILGNTFKCLSDNTALTSVTSKEYALNYYTEVYPNLKETKVAHMVINYDPVSFEMGELKNRYEEYKNTVTYGCGGSANFEATYNEVMEKLNEAGLQKIKNELNAQIADYIAK